MVVCPVCKGRGRDPDDYARMRACGCERFGIAGPCKHCDGKGKIKVNQDDICPGIKDFVEELQRLGYETTDSGDGSNHEDGMECALPFRHVFGVVPDGEPMREFADRMKARFAEAHVEVSYSPGEPAVWALFPDGPPK